MDSRCFELNAPDVIAETIDGEVMVMNLRQGIYYSVTGAGAKVWPALVAGAPAGACAEALARAAGADATAIARDCATFLQRLEDEAILRTVASPPRHDLAIDVAPGEIYAGFGFERFDDMRAMLVIDPVHEVGDFGWPQAAAPKEP